MDLPVEAKLFMSSTNILIDEDRSTVIYRDIASLLLGKWVKSREMCFFFLLLKIFFMIM